MKFPSLLDCSLPDSANKPLPSKLSDGIGSDTLKEDFCCDSSKPQRCGLSFLQGTHSSKPQDPNLLFLKALSHKELCRETFLFQSFECLGYGGNGNSGANAQVQSAGEFFLQRKAGVKALLYFYCKPASGSSETPAVPFLLWSTEVQCSFIHPVGRDRGTALFLAQVCAFNTALTDPSHVKEIFASFGICAS